MQSDPFVLAGSYIEALVPGATVEDHELVVSHENVWHMLNA